MIRDFSFIVIALITLNFLEREVIIDGQINANTFVKGSKNGQALLDEVSVEHIKHSSFSISNLAKYYEVSYHTIWDVKRGRSWKHIK
jgi:hypothetical protein